jgi:hypothetical protein
VAKNWPVPGSSPEGEHIFPAAQLTPLAVRWKELSAAGRHKEAMFVLEQIVEGSTAMFERLAQFEDFHYTVDLPILVSAAQEKVVKWLQKWQPKKGRLFSWFSKCAKNAFRSELVKVNQYRKRYHVTSDNLERFYGVEDHAVDKHDIAKEFHDKLKQMTCRWGDPQEIAAIRYLIDCILDDDRDKQGAIRGCCYAYCISLDLSKFFYGWVVSALRHELYDRVHIPFTEQDLFRAAFSYEHVVDLLDYVDWDTCKKIMVRWQGQRIKFPTLVSMIKLRENYAIHRDIDKSDLDPDAVAEVARKRKRTARSAQEIFNEMATVLDPKRTGEYGIYEQPDDP